MELIQQNINGVFTDFHTHILPAMDDGPQDANVSVKMLCKLKKQGVSRVCLTPHYIHHREPVLEFIERRKISFATLKEEINKQGLNDAVPEMVLGAEVAVERALVDEDDIKKLCYEDTNLILLEFPFERPEQKIFTLIENLYFKYGVRPVIAHLDRYMDIFTWDQILQVINLPGAVLQFNYSSTGFFGCGSFIKRLKSEGVPVVLGSDCHNEKSRPPKIKPM